MSDAPENVAETPAVDPLKDGIRRALEAASAANDAAEEFSALSEQTRKAIADALAAQKRASVIATGSLVGALLCVGLGGLVYLRSMADLREAAEIQAAANKATIEQAQYLAQSVDTATKAADRIAELDEKFSAQIDGLGDRLQGEIDRIAQDSAALQPQIATTISEKVTASVEQFRGEILTALAELEVKGGGGSPAVNEDILKLLAEMRAALPKAAPAAPKQTTKAAVKPSGKPSQKTAPKPEPSPFKFP